MVAVVPARDEGDLIGATVRSLGSIPEVTEVVVVDDGSRDGTASAALAAGASVLRSRRPRGKGTALEAAFVRLPQADVWLLADGDLGETAVGLAPVLREVLMDRADLAIAVLPPPEIGGFGSVKRFARAAILALCGFEAREPLSGQRAVRREALAVARPIARGFGVETAMTIDVVRGGFTAVEVGTGLAHRPTRRDLAGFVHRGRQGIDIAVAILVRAAGMR